jgi:hypothetical protein
MWDTLLSGELPQLVKETRMQKKIITGDTLEKSAEFLTRNCRTLEQKRFAQLFGEGSASDVLEALLPYQNVDGGFGNGLEPDFWLPDSSPMATTIAFQIFAEIGTAPPNDMVASGLRYFETQYDPTRKGWYAVPPAVNDSPHAPWWQYDPVRPGSVIDLHWGNPSAEIIGYVYKYAHRDTRLPLEDLVSFAIEHLNDLTEFQSPHEVYCYLRLHSALPEGTRASMTGQLSTAIRELVSLDPVEWEKYVPRPVDFIQTPQSPFYASFQDGVERSLDFLVDTLSESGVWFPHWSWGPEEEVWEAASVQWAGVLTIHNLKILQNFGRIE